MLANLKMKNKLILLIALPLIGFLYFSTSGFVRELQNFQNMNKLYSLTNLILLNSNLIHELQLERGLSVLYVGTKGSKGDLKLQNQRALVDKEISNLKNFLVKSKNIDKTI